MINASGQMEPGLFNMNSAVYAALVSFTLCVILCPLFIPYLTRLKIGQNVRDDGPKTHLKKTGTPTMGGIVIVAAMVVSALLFVWGDREGLIAVLTAAAFGLVGFLDDYIKVVKKRSLGLRAYQKMAMQLLITAAFIGSLYYFKFNIAFYIPFSNGMYVDLGLFSPVLLFIVMLGSVNGANFTDGLDGLASGVTVLIVTFFLFIASRTGSGLLPASGAAAGALLGFLLFNSHPARVIMGDTGSLALGGFVAAAAIMLNMSFVLVIVAFVYVAEVGSVMLQVGFFKLTKGKRLFKMAPIHHHFEMMGWPETRVVMFFYVVSAILCLIGFLSVNSMFV